MLLSIKAVLDDGGASEQSLLEATKGLILHLDGSFLLQWATIVVAALLEDRHEDVLLLLLLLVILVIFLAHAHLIARLCINGFFQDALEHFVHILSTSLLVDGLFTLISRSNLALHLLFLGVNLLMAVHFELMVLLLDLLLLRFFLPILVVHIVNVCVSDEVISVPLFITSCNLALLVVVVDVDCLHQDVKLSLLDLVGSGQVLIKFEFLSHLVDHKVLVRVVVRLDLQDALLGRVSMRRESHGAIDEPVRPILVLFNDLVLLVKELLTKDQAILLPMVIEIELTIAAIDANHLLPVVELERRLVVLDQFEFVWETSANHEFVLAASIVAADFNGD